jgi:hypothetical protein
MNPLQMVEELKQVSGDFDVSVKPLINISMISGANRGTGGSNYNATNTGGSFSNGKFIVNNSSGYLQIPTEFIYNGSNHTIAFTVDCYEADKYSFFMGGSWSAPNIARGGDPVCVASLSTSWANSTYTTLVDSSFANVADSGNYTFHIPTDTPTTFVFRNDGENISFWVNGSLKMTESVSRLPANQRARYIMLGGMDSGGSLAHMECSMFKIWDCALPDAEIPYIK